MTRRVPFTWTLFPLTRVLLELFDRDDAGLEDFYRAYRRVDAVEAWRLAGRIPSVWG